VASVLGSLVNDSGAIVGGVTVMVVAASLVCLVLEADAPVVVDPARTNGAAPAVASADAADAEADVDADATPAPRPDPEPGADPGTTAAGTEIDDSARTTS
jgi:hypothetical protein